MATKAPHIIRKPVNSFDNSYLYHVRADGSCKWIASQFLAKRFYTVGEVHDALQSAQDDTSEVEVVRLKLKKRTR